MFLKQEEFNKELESLKTLNQKQLLEFQQSLHKENIQESNKIDKKKSILQSLL
ncbi:hypothetical protein [Flavivirga sp. 57AJ16]|uniref:hypothetical protein n=1 Tax=Flavivirga sp. 57AJ16 TaxID=3025307 RepID=UPI002367119E|nr:hypothetical protein [Flavivirga sp. 57AJ16]MDD7884507.1 hypothetical protein [Flavivirga sp. 57AJ16]